MTTLSTPPPARPAAPSAAPSPGPGPDAWALALQADPGRSHGAARIRREQWLMIACFFMLFPGFFFYHTLLGTGTTGAFLGGYFAPVALAFAGPMCLVYLGRMRRDARRLTLVDVHYGVFFAYFVGVVVVNAAAGANRAIVVYHLLAILFMVLVYIQFCYIDFDSRRFRAVGLLSLAGMSTIVFSYSVDGVFYLGALGIAKDANALATYQGFSRSYLFTYLAVATFTRSLPLRLGLHALGAATLFVNTARSEFVALLFAIPLIEFYYSRHKLYFVLAGVCIATALGLYLDQILASLPSNRILELFDLSHSTSANKRQQLTVHAMQSIAAHPILGDYGSYKPGHYSHNVLSAWVDLGFFGMAYVAALAIVPITPMFFHEYSPRASVRSSCWPSPSPASPCCCCCLHITSPTCCSAPPSAPAAAMPTRGNMPRIVHLTSAHPRHDTRIFVKQCRTLASHGHEVFLVVADGLGDELRDGVRIVDAAPRGGRGAGLPPGRLGRMLWTTRRVAAQARALDADAYQLHDPELLPAGLRLRRAGMRVVFDAHEDVPTQLLDKPYLARGAARLLARLYARYERYACARLDGLLAATRHIRERLAHCNPRAVDVANFPLPEEFSPDSSWHARTQVCYVGSISAIRGIREMVQACALLRSPARLALAGSFADPELQREVALLPGWTRVRALGHLDRAGVRRALESAFAGLVTLLPTASYRDALPVKMFEYMAAGIPVIASDFPRWRAIVEASDCGLCVDPQDPVAIAAAIDRLAQDPALAQRMGANGRRAIEQTYNWNNEAQKLVRFYADLTLHPLAHRLADISETV